MRPITGHLALELIAGHRVLAGRNAHNSVMQGGAQLVADLFRGAVATPVNGMAVGLSPDPAAPPYSATALTTTNPDGTPAVTAFAIPIAADAIAVELVERDFLVRLRVRGLVPATAARPVDEAAVSVLIAEAALGVLAPDGQSLTTLYNRVTFEPIAKAADQEIALYWDIDFPYGA